MSGPRVDGSRLFVAGRRRELAELLTALDSSMAGESRVVLLGGEPGIGKTHLLDAVAEVATERGATVLRGAAFEDTIASPYAVFADVLRSLVRLRPASAESFRHPAVLELAAQLVPELAGDGVRDAPADHPAGDVRERLIDRFIVTLTALAEQQSLVLLLDDVHWSDEQSALLLRRLVRALRSYPVLVVIAYRDTDVTPDSPIEHVTRELGRDRAARRVVLRRFDHVATAELIAHVLGCAPAEVSTSLVDAVQRESEGVPLFSEELVLHVRDEQLLTRAADGKLELRERAAGLVPQSIKSVIGHRLARLSPAAASHLTVAAVIGRQFGYDELRTTLALRDDQAIDTLDETLRVAGSMRLLEIVGDASPGDPVVYRFAHEQIRDVLYASISPLRRRALHQSAAFALEQLGAGRISPARLAYHFGQGEDAALAASYALLAAERAAAVHAVEEALSWYDDALAAIELTAQPIRPDRSLVAEHFDIQLAREALLAETDDHQRQLDATRALLRLAGDVGTDHAQFTAELRAARAAVRAGTPAQAHPHAERAVALATTLDRAAQAEALLALAEANMGRPAGEPATLEAPRGALESALAALQSAFTSAQDSDDALLQARVAQELGVVMWELAARDDPAARADARAQFLTALDRFRAAADRRGELTALIGLAYRRSVKGEAAAVDPADSYVSFLEEIRRLRTTTHQLARESDRPRLDALTSLSIHLYCRTNGWYEMALARAQRAADIAGTIRDRRIALVAQLGLSETERLIGRPVQALERGQHARALLEADASASARLASFRGEALGALAAAYALAGDLERGVALARERLAGAIERGFAPAITEAETQLAELLVELGDDSGAAAYARGALERVQRLRGNVTWDIRAELVLARVALRTGQASLAVGHVSAAQASVMARDTPHRWLITAVHIARAVALETAGFTDEAREAAGAAIAGVELLAARFGDADLRSAYTRGNEQYRAARDVARRLGVALSPPAPASPGARPANLTPRELEIIRLVAAGRSNREIADALFISEKTVARHLTNTFTKIDVESRTQAAAWAYRQGLA